MVLRELVGEWAEGTGVLRSLGSLAASERAECTVVPCWLMWSSPSRKDPLSLRLKHFDCASSVGMIESPRPVPSFFFDRFAIQLDPSMLGSMLCRPVVFVRV